METKKVVGELLPKSKPHDKRWDNLIPRTKGDGKSNGRQKGSLNKVTREVKDVIQRCFDSIGGEVAFARWARRNPDEFYKIYAKLLPIKLQATESKEINVYITRDDASL